MNIEHKIHSDEPVSAVTINGEPAFTMGQNHLMLGLIGSSNPIYQGAHYGDDYFIRDRPQGNVIGRWFVEQYGWKRFWPPGATLPRVEHLMRTLCIKAERAQQALASLSARIAVDETLHRQHFTRGHTKEEDYEVLVCGMNRYGNVIEYMVNKDGKGGYATGSAKPVTERTPLGDEYARVVDRSWSGWCQYYRFQNVFRDCALRCLLAQGATLGVHRLVVNEHGYWLRIFEERLPFNGKKLSVESLDDHGNAKITETVAI